MGRNWGRDEPERDFEDWANREDTRPIVGYCPVCDEPVYGENEGWDADDAYEFDGDVVHADCLIKYLDREGYKL